MSATGQSVDPLRIPANSSRNLSGFHAPSLSDVEASAGRSVEGYDHPRGSLPGMPPLETLSVHAQPFQ